MVFIALGANQDARYLGETHTPRETFFRVLSCLTENAINVKSVSGLWQSPAWPDPQAQPAYTNAVINVETALAPQDLLTFLKRLEQQFGRKPSQRNAPRPLDLDILDFGGEVLKTKTLTLPHPRMCKRGFVLFPLQEITPHWRDPIKDRAIKDWIAQLHSSDVDGLKYLGRFT